MIRYEVLILAAPETTDDESSALETQLDQLIKKANSSMLSFERWGKYKLAYPVRGNEYGIYFLMRFETDTAQVMQLLKDVDALLAVKHAAIVMRHMITKLDPKDSLAYIKPESLEDIPSQDAEQKIKGVLHTTVSTDVHDGIDHDYSDRDIQAS